MQTVYSLKNLTVNELKDVVKRTMTTSLEIVDQVPYSKDYVVEHKMLHLGAGIITEKYLVCVCSLTEDDFLLFLDSYK